MQILFASLPAYGHLYPLIPTALAARKAGHQVTFATARDYLPVLEQFGLATVAAGISMAEAFTDPSLASIRRERSGPSGQQAGARRVFGDIMPRHVAKDLALVIDELRPDLVVEEILNPGAGLAARPASVPVVEHGFGRLSLDPLGMIFGGLAELAAELGVRPPNPVDDGT